MDESQSNAACYRMLFCFNLSYATLCSGIHYIWKESVEMWDSESECFRLAAAWSSSPHMTPVRELTAWRSALSVSCDVRCRSAQLRNQHECIEREPVSAVDQPIHPSSITHVKQMSSMTYINLAPSTSRGREGRQPRKKGRGEAMPASP